AGGAANTSTFWTHWRGRQARTSAPSASWVALPRPIRSAAEDSIGISPVPASTGPGTFPAGGAVSIGLTTVSSLASAEGGRRWLACAAAARASLPGGGARLSRRWCSTFPAVVLDFPPALLAPGSGEGHENILLSRAHNT